MNTEILKNDYIINSCSVKELLTLKFNCPGVYILHDTDDIKFSCYTYASNLYVGKSKNIHQRIKTHSVKLPYVTFIGFLNAPSQGLIDATEDVMIKIMKEWCKKSNKTLLNTEQVKEDIDTLLVKYEYKILKHAVKDIIKCKISLSEYDLNCKLMSHKPKDKLKLSTLLNLQVIKGYTYSFENKHGYTNLNREDIDFTNDNHLVDSVFHENYIEYIKFNDYYVFLTDEDLLYIKRKNIELNNNVKYVHIGVGNAINGSSKYDIKYLDYNKWKKQDFSFDDLVGDSFDDFEKITKLDNYPMSFEDYMML